MTGYDPRGGSTPFFARGHWAHWGRRLQLQVTQQVERANHADEHLVLVNHEQPMDGTRQRVIDYACDARVGFGQRTRLGSSRPELAYEGQPPTIRVTGQSHNIG